MSAEVETMFYTRQKPWHGLGTMVTEAPDSKSALELAGLNWTVIQKPIKTQDGLPIPGFKANMRNTPGRPPYLAARQAAPALYYQRGRNDALPGVYELS